MSKSEDIPDLGEDDLLDDASRTECLRCQLSECEALQAVYCNPGEISVDYGLIHDLESYVNGRETEIPAPLSYDVNLDVSGRKVLANVCLPLAYPRVAPNVFVRSESLDRSRQGHLNRELAMYISKLQRVENILDVIDWLHQNFLDYCSKDEKSATQGKLNKEKKEKELFSRLWIYSHHIYSKEKRRDILSLTSNYQLTGFCLPGKPGILCIEGCKSDCDEFWQKVRNMTWQKIMCIKEERGIVEEDIEKQRKFKKFNEIFFNSGKLKSQDRRMDFGEFHKYLRENDCEYMFKEFFGLEGKS